MNTYVIEFNFDNCSRYHSTVKAANLNEALSIAEAEGSKLDTDDIPTYATLKASNYYNIHDSNWDKSIINAREKRFN